MGVLLKVIRREAFHIGIPHMWTPILLVQSAQMSTPPARSLCISLLECTNLGFLLPSSAKLSSKFAGGKVHSSQLVRYTSLLTGHSSLVPVCTETLQEHSLFVSFLNNSLSSTLLCISLHISFCFCFVLNKWKPVIHKFSLT